MAKSGESIGRRLDRWIDEWKMALSGIVLATREWRFLLAFVLSFIIFGTLMSLLSSGGAAWNLFWATDLGGKLAILGDGLLAIFGVGRSFLDWLLVFMVTVLQSVLIGLIVLVWQKRRRSQREQVVASAHNASNIQDAGLVTGLAILGSGCPTCGTTLLTPILGAFFSSSSYALAGAISGILTFIAVLLALFALKRVGRDAYAMIKSERFQKRRSAKQEKENQDAGAE